jgi:hypothetical protein
MNTSQIPTLALTLNDAATLDLLLSTTLRYCITQVAHWQAPLLEHLKPKQDEQRLHHLLTQAPPITFEVQEDLGSFGWNIAVAQETLWHCKGPTFGLLPGSFRAESYGMMSALLFLDTYFKPYGTQLDATTILKFYCDSSSLLKRIARTHNRSWINPTTCLAADFDLESGIIDLLLALPITIKCIHVKSHPDDDTEVHLLPWAAQMNVQANHLAMDYLDNYSDPSKILSFIRPSQASLTIQGKTITR